MKLYSKRQMPEVRDLHDFLDERARVRVLATIGSTSDRYRMDTLLNDVAQTLIEAYGALESPSYNLLSENHLHPAIAHFHRCDAVGCIDFLEALFHSAYYEGGQQGVERVNAILQEIGFAYEFTGFAYTEATWRKDRQVSQFPQAICRGNHELHQNVTVPAFELLASPTFRVANEEMRKAHAAFRLRQYDDAMTLAGSAFESVLKTICTEKRWLFDANKDTCSRLVDICYSHGLFPSFYVEILKSAGTLRNKLGDAHGRGPHNHCPPTKVNAEHHLNLVGAHILFLHQASGVK